MTRLDDIPSPDPAWFIRPDGEDGSRGIHGVMHTRRVLIHASEIATALTVEPWIREAVVRAALWHDIGRTDDGRDYYHGAKSAGKVVGLGLRHGLSRPIVELALLAVTHHSGGEEYGVRAAEDFFEDPDAALLVFRILKDADGLDRVRLGDLDVNRLRLPGSDRRVERAEELLRLFPDGDESTLEEDACRGLAAMWNLLDPTPLFEILAPDVVWESQMVFEPLRGRDAVTAYLTGKLETLRSTRTAHPVVAELGRCGIDRGGQVFVLSANPGRPCVIVYQGEGVRHQGPSALALVEVADGLVRRVDLCSVAPSPSSAVRTGEFPGLAASPFDS
jgi:hypothetical protein